MNALFSFLKRQFLNYLLLIAAGVALGLGIWGWWDVYPQLTPHHGLENQFTFALHQGLRAFVFSDVYADYSEAHFSWKIELAGLIGSLVAISAIIKAILAVFVRPIERFRAARRSGHVVVIGDRPIAINAAEKIEEKRKVTYHGDSKRMELSRVLSVVRPQSLDSVFMHRSVNGAERVIVAEDNDGTTAETALKLATHMKKATVFALLENPWIASNLRPALDDLDDEDFLIPVSETRALARAAVLRVPPFLLAKRARHKRVHILFYGFSHLTIAMIEEVLATGIVPTQRLPRFTILTENAEEAATEFRSRHPNLETETRRSNLGPIHVEFISCPSTGVSADACQALASLPGDEPVTIAYVTRDDDHEPLAAALALQLSSRQHNLFTCPIFVQSRHGNGMKPIAWQEDYPERGLFAFGGWEDLAMALGIMDRDPDKLAKAYHENYRRVVWNDTDATRNWEVLPESLRIANRNAVLHLPAKLSSMGFDITPYLKQDDVLSPGTAPFIQPQDNLIKSESDRELLAHLEHERWMMDRWINGWRFAEHRDNNQLHHPDLIPYQQLSEEKKDVDRAFVDWLDDWIDHDASSGIHRIA